METFEETVALEGLGDAGNEKEKEKPSNIGAFGFSPTSSIAVVFSYWKDFNLENERTKLDEQGLRIGENQEVSLKNRRKLAENTRDFKKASPEDKQKMFNSLLKGYQEEVDNLTKRAKFGENAFLNIYQKLYEAPDPVPALASATDLSLKVTELESENRKMKHELEEYRTEAAHLRNQQATVRRLEERNRQLELQMEEKVKEIVEMKQRSLAEENQKMLEVLKEREQSLQDQLRAAKETVQNMQRLHEYGQSQLFEFRAQNEEERAAKQAELNLLTDEVERAQTRLLSLEREKEQLRSQLQIAHTPENAVQERQESGTNSTLEASLLEKEKKISELHIELNNLEMQLSVQHEQHLSELKRLNSLVNEKITEIEDLQKSLEQRPTIKQVEDLRKQVKILQAVGYNSIEAEDWEVATTGEDMTKLEALLLDKNRKMEHELTQLKVQLAEKVKVAEAFEVKAKEMEMKIDQQQELITKLEEDILRGYNSLEKRTTKADDWGLAELGASDISKLIATSCMFLAGKVEETPQKLCDVIFLSYEIRNKKDPTAVQRIKQKDVYEPQKELVLLGERMILTTLGFDLNIHHPYKPLVAAIKKFKVAQNALAQVAWNFVNDGLRTSLCLQFKPHHIAAGAIFLAAKFLKVKLPSEGEKVWWQEFDVTPRQLEEVSNQMLELYEQNREAPASRVSDPSTTANQSRAVGDSARDTKGKVSSGIVRSVHDVAPAATDEHRDTSEKDAIESKARVGSSSKVSCQPKSGAMSDLKITMEGEAKCVADMNRDKSNSNEIFHSSIQVAETKMSVQVTEISTCSGGSNACVNDTKSVSHAVVQFSEVTVDQKCKGSIENGEPAADTNSAGTHPCEVRPSEGMISDGVDDVKQDDQTSQPKSGWVDLADVDIDRVKAAIQRRKKGDRKRSLAKRELTDEEELLEMELENGRSDVPNGLHHDDRDLSVMDLEAEELLERGFERGKERDVHLRNSLLLHKHADKEKLDIDGCILAEQERDHKRPRVDSGK